MSEKNLEIQWKHIFWIALLFWPAMIALGFFGNAYIAQDRLGKAVIDSKACVEAQIMSHSSDKITGKEDVVCTRAIEPIPYSPRRQYKKKKKKRSRT